MPLPVTSASRRSVVSRLFMHSANTQSKAFLMLFHPPRCSLYGQTLNSLTIASRGAVWPLLSVAESFCIVSSKEFLMPFQHSAQFCSSSFAFVLVCAAYQQPASPSPYSQWSPGASFWRLTIVFCSTKLFSSASIASGHLHFCPRCRTSTRIVVLAVFPAPPFSLSPFSPPSRVSLFCLPRR